MQAVNPFRNAAFAISCLLIGLSSLSCNEEKSRKRRFTDSEGREFKASCRPGKCEKLRQTRGPKWPKGKKRLLLKSSGRYFGVCNTASGAEPESLADCRVLVCEKDSQCPHPIGLDSGSCLTGYCAEPSQGFTVQDSVMLCLAGLGLGMSQSEQIERYSMGLNCGEPCQIPSPCRDAWKIDSKRAVH